MPKRTDIHSILIIGAGPIVIGQACEFDYSGAQACKALREEGYRVILVNSNPATIMTDPDTADAVYIEPIDWRSIRSIIAKERPDAILPTMGGQTALNTALALDKHGVLAEFGVEMIGASKDAIDMAEDRHKFRQAMDEIGLESTRAFMAHNFEEAQTALGEIGFPIIIRPSFTMGGSGGGIAYNRQEFNDIVRSGLELSPSNEIQLEESILGWKEYEMEVVRDRNDNSIIVCSIENFDPMGVHTGDSITVAPAQTLTDKEYQIMRDASLAVLRKIGVETGGSNVQFALNPDDGRLIIIEMNPRVSRSSALASKATGFPIAKVAAKLAVGFTLDELKNDITGGATPASFEPTIDYVVTKIPRFTFEKFPTADDRLTTQMKSVGEVMAIGRNQQESLQKAMRGLEIGVDGFSPVLDPNLPASEAIEKIESELRVPRAMRLWYIGEAFRHGFDVEKVFALTKIDRWFLEQIQELIAMEQALVGQDIGSVDAPLLQLLKRKGFADSRLGTLLGVPEPTMRAHRHALGIHPVYKRVDSCAAEFAASTAYMYSCYESHCEAAVTARKKMVVLGGGPNRIGQGIEFDYCCVHAAFALREHGFETIMINCNPETVSTDYDTSDRLYFEPLTLEDVLEIIRIEQPQGVIVQYGGQTPLKLARDLEAAGVPIIGTSPDSIDLAEDRERFSQLIHKLQLKQPPNRTARSLDAALKAAGEIGYPLVVRPSYVLGGRAMEVVSDDADLKRYINEAVSVSNHSPVLLDRFLNDAIEVDVDAICDANGQVLIGGVMEHIEEAGVHSGDSACSLPPYSLSAEIQAELRRQVTLMARELKVVGLMNTQFAIQGDAVYVLEVNPRASRSVPYVSKASGVALAKIAALCMAGISLQTQNATREVIPEYFSVKETVFPFIKFAGVDVILGPEMKSTGEVMGVGKTFGEAFAKAQLGAGMRLPKAGNVLISVRDKDKIGIIEVAQQLKNQGFCLYATGGTADALTQAGLDGIVKVNKVTQERPNIADMLKDEVFDLIINTTLGKQSIKDSYLIRREAVNQQVPIYTTLAGAKAVCMAMQFIEDYSVNSLQQLHQTL